MKYKFQTSLYSLPTPFRSLGVRSKRRQTPRQTPTEERKPRVKWRSGPGRKNPDSDRPRRTDTPGPRTRDPLCVGARTTGVVTPDRDHSPPRRLKCARSSFHDVLQHPGTVGVRPPGSRRQGQRSGGLPVGPVRDTRTCVERRLSVERVKGSPNPHPCKDNLLPRVCGSPLEGPLRTRVEGSFRDSEKGS